MTRRILVPLDLSAAMDAVLDYAHVLARGLDATLTLFHVYDPPSSMVGIVPGATVDDELAIERAAAASLMSEAVARLARAGFTRVETLNERAPQVARAILARASSGNFELVVMGTHGRRGLPRLVIGSVAEEVLRRAPCPVLTIHLPPDPQG